MKTTEQFKYLLNNLKKESFIHKSLQQSEIKDLYSEYENLLNDNRLSFNKNYLPFYLDKDSAFLIYCIIHITKPKTILEIGMAEGFSTSVFGLYAKKNDAKIISLEINEDACKKAANNFKILKIDDIIKIVNEDGVKFVKKTKKRFDFLFLDAEKSKYKEFLIECIENKQVKPKMIIADNIYFPKTKGAEEYVEELNRRKIKNITVDIGKGLSVARID